MSLLYTIINTRTTTHETIIANSVYCAVVYPARVVLEPLPTSLEKERATPSRRRSIPSSAKLCIIAMHGALAFHVDGDAITCRLAVPSCTIHGRESPADVAPAASTTANLVTGRYPPSTISI